MKINNTGDLPSAEHRALRDYWFIRRACPLICLMWSCIEDIVVFQEPWRMNAYSDKHVPCSDCFAFGLNMPALALQNVIARDCEALPFGRLFERPGWCDACLDVSHGRYGEESALGLCLPHAVMVLVIQHSWTTLTICGRFVESTKDRKLLGHVTGQRRFVPPEDDGIAERSRVSLESHMFERAASLLRGERDLFEDVDDEVIGHVDQRDVLAWLDTMASQTRHGLDHVAQVSRGFVHRLGGRDMARAFKMEALITSLLLAQVLRKDALLAQAVEHSGVFLGMRTGSMENDQSSLPHKATLSTHRFTLDCGYALLVRDLLRLLLDSGRFFFLICWRTVVRAPDGNGCSLNTIWSSKTWWTSSFNRCGRSSEGKRMARATCSR